MSRLKYARGVSGDLRQKLWRRRTGGEWTGIGQEPSVEGSNWPPLSRHSHARGRLNGCRIRAHAGTFPKEPFMGTFSTINSASAGHFLAIAHARRLT